MSWYGCVRVKLNTISKRQAAITVRNDIFFFFFFFFARKLAHAHASRDDAYPSSTLRYATRSSPNPGLVIFHPPRFNSQLESKDISRLFVKILPVCEENEFDYGFKRRALLSNREHRLKALYDTITRSIGPILLRAIRASLQRNYRNNLQRANILWLSTNKQSTSSPCNTVVGTIVFP